MIRVTLMLSKKLSSIVSFTEQLKTAALRTRPLAIKATIEKLTNNGYTVDEIKRSTRNRTKTKTREKNDQLAFRFPFISNRLYTQIRRSLARNNISARIIHPRPQTLLQLAQPPNQTTWMSATELPDFIHKLHDVLCYIWDRLQRLQGHIHGFHHSCPARLGKGTHSCGKE